MRTRLLRAVFVALLFFSFSASAQDTPAFFIQRIVVRNADRVSAAVIVAESRLREGQLYSEEALREANDRLRRLPFLLDATFALEKGDARDQYVLAISVSETKPLFFLFDAVLYRRDDNNLQFDASNDVVLGTRYFVGRGAIHFGFFGRDPQGPFANKFSALQAGYTQYDIFGSRAFVTIAANQIFGYGTSSRPQPEIVIGVPLSAKHTATLSYVANQYGSDRRSTERFLDSRWSYNTTNHPFFPTRGVVVSAGGLVVWRDQQEQFFMAEPVLIHSRVYSPEIAVKKYWEWPRSNSLGAEVTGGYARVEQRRNGVPDNFSDRYGRALVRFSHALHGDESVSQSRLELTLRNSSRSFDVLAPSGAAKQLSVSWARRNAWGALRLGVGYAW